jgi:DNA invertase Pin-like site-specific DNA recombinase
LPGGRRLIGYARVSTHDQHPELQLDALRAAHCSEIFVETASGAAAERPQLRAAIEAARPGDTLAVWKLDRLGRSLLQMIETVRELDERKVGFVSLTESIDTTTTAGRLVLHIFGAIAEFERSMIIERTLAGLEAARARGRIGGRRKKLSDAEVEAGRALLLNTETPIAEIAHQLGVALSTFYAYFPASKAQRTQRRRRDPKQS